MDAGEFFDTTLANAVSIIELSAEVCGVMLSKADRETIRAGASAGITAAVDELTRRGMLLEGGAS